MSVMKSILPVPVAVVLIVLFGVIQGVATDRWATSSDLQDSLEVLPRVPSHIADWEGEDLPIDNDLSRMGILGSVQRRYRNKLTHATVVLLIVCGRGGPICVHTPDICYASAGYKELTPEVRRDIETNEKNQFVTCHFGKPDLVVPSRLEIFWGWSRDGGNWKAPENPRFSLARSRSLYKLYAIREFLPGTRSENSGATEAFLQSALPVIRQSLARSGS